MENKFHAFLDVVSALGVPAFGIFIVFCLHVALLSIPQSF